jgi:hypothetical protein
LRGTSAGRRIQPALASPPRFPGLVAQPGSLSHSKTASGSAPHGQDGSDDKRRIEGGDKGGNIF